jgi:hypothetical protein
MEALAEALVISTWHDLQFMASLRTIGFDCSLLTGDRPLSRVGLASGCRPRGVLYALGRRKRAASTQ